MFTAFYNGTLSSFSLLTEEIHTYKGGEYGLQDVQRVALDYDNRMIYVTAHLAASDHGTRYLVRLDYADTVMTIVYQGPELDDPFGLDVFKESIVWVEDKDNTIYICKLTATCDQKDVKVLHSGPSEVSTQNNI